MEWKSKRVAAVPPYLFSHINKQKAELLKMGADVIDLGIGAPDLPTAPHIVDKLIEEMKDPLNFKYSSYGGCDEFREAVAAYYQREFSVELDPSKEILALIGSKEGIGHFFPSVLNPGDSILLPDPGYPAYQAAAVLAGIEPISYPLKEENLFIVDFDDIEKQKAEEAKALVLNYPGNPTAASVEPSFFQTAADFAEKYNLLLIHDAAYNRVTFGAYDAPSLLQAKGERGRLVEFGSLSKAYCMTGWRIGYAAGSEKALESLAVMKSNLDTSQFLPVQKAAAFALTGDQACVKKQNHIFENRMETMYKELRKGGIELHKPKGSIFLWCKVPGQRHSKEFAENLLKKEGVIVSPGAAFGSAGENYFRISLSVDENRLLEAAARISHFIAEGGS
ncbi:aminotransferase class I/II-fold pyridoxal phosphate-dependent enzyme [Alteribacillus sp. HJP-4]|uniref:aminotransferase class I/II-fold pyridoxal phosphate-dependent enzyme n=1 Tax=Alteribacillus sp. HJP-4 TaxID=2775394 RepID=UPI0035CCE12C